MKDVIEQKVQALVNGKTVNVSDAIREEVRNRLREIKKNVTLVLSQIKENSK